DPLALAVCVVAAREDVRRGQTHLGQRGAVGSTANRRLPRLESHPANRLLEVGHDLRIPREPISRVEVLDAILDLDRAARFGSGDLLRESAQEGDMLGKAVVLEVAGDEAQLDRGGVTLDEDRVDVSLASLARLGRKPVAWHPRAE